jgi:hypothetical protein
VSSWQGAIALTRIACHLDHARLGDAEGEVAAPHSRYPARRGCVDNAPVYACFDHPLAEALGDKERGVQVDAQVVAEVLEGHLLRQDVRATSNVVEQDLHPRDKLCRLLHDRSRPFGPRSVTDNDKGVAVTLHLFGDMAHWVLSHVDQDDRCTATSKTYRHRAADCSSGTGDHCVPARKVEKIVCLAHSRSVPTFRDRRLGLPPSTMLTVDDYQANEQALLAVRTARGALLGPPG